MARKTDKGNKNKKDLKRRVRERMESTGESYSTALMHLRNAAAAPEDAEVQQFFRRAAENMIADRPFWQSGPKVDLDWWLALDEVPLENGKRSPTKAYHALDIGSMQRPLREALARNIVEAGAVDGADHELSGAILLGTVILETEAGTPRPFRLPPPLGQWAAGQVGLTRQGRGQFPSFLGFCRPKPGQYGVEFMPIPEEHLEKYRRALTEWRALPELPIFKTTSTGPAERYEVLKAGGFFLPAEACPDVPEAEHIDGARVILPTATIWTLAGSILYRLPLALGRWVILNLGASASGTKLFPAFVEFSFVDGHYSASFADVPTEGR